MLLGLVFTVGFLLLTATRAFTNIKLKSANTLNRKATAISASIPIGMDLEQFLHKMSLSDSLTETLLSLAESCITIAETVSVAPLIGVIGAAQTESVNSSGESQKKLDILSNEIIKNGLNKTKFTAVMASEENDVPEILKETIGENHKVVVVDPLDGSSNIDCSIPTGSIFGVYELLDVKNLEKSCMQPGNNLLAAGYCLYSSSTELVISPGKTLGTYGFTLDRRTDSPRFILTRDKIVCPHRGPYWPPGLRRYVGDIKVIFFFKKLSLYY